MTGIGTLQQLFVWSTENHKSGLTSPPPPPKKEEEEEERERKNVITCS